MEEWKDIPGYEGVYRVSDTGKIISIRRNLHRKLTADKLGYLKITLSNNGININYFVHRLVMLTFVGKSNLPVNHKDGNASNNNLINLEYCTHQENMDHAKINGLIATKLSKEDVVQIKRMLIGGVVKQAKIARIFGVNKSTITKIKKNTKWKHVVI